MYLRDVSKVYVHNNLNRMSRNATKQFLILQKNVFYLPHYAWGIA